jgi:hypothetical protein
MTADQPVEHGRASADWLTLREPADAAARSVRLLDDLLRHLRPTRDDPTAGTPLVVHDLGSGTGSQRRWLAPRLPRSQRWVEHDRDGVLVARPTDASTGRDTRVEVRSCTCELAELTADHLTPADLVTGSALLDVLTAPAVELLVGVTARLKVPLLLTLTVVGRVRLSPADILDDAVLAASNDHQRRRTEAGQLLGPDAVAHATELLLDSGAVVRSEPSPWVLNGAVDSAGAGDSAGALATAWFDGWLDAALDQDPTLAPHAGSYRTRRRAEIAGGRLEVVVEHLDLLAWWP